VGLDIKAAWLAMTANQGEYGSLCFIRSPKEEEYPKTDDEGDLDFGRLLFTKIFCLCLEKLWFLYDYD
jgi:hypothetical protein